MSKLRKMLAVMAAVTTIVVSGVPASAADAVTSGYEVNDPEYAEYVDKANGYLSNKELENILIKAYNSDSGNFQGSDTDKESVRYQYRWECKHIMSSLDDIAVLDDIYVCENGSISCDADIELGRPDDVEKVKGRTRRFERASVDLSRFIDKNGINIKDVRKLFSDKQFKASAKYHDSENGYRGLSYVEIRYDRNVTTDEICEILCALDENFGLLPSVSVSDSRLDKLYTDKAEDTVPTFDDTAETISNYIENNNIEAFCSWDENTIQLSYLDKNAKSALEKYIKESGIDKTKVKIKEMSRRDKCRRVLHYGIIKKAEEDLISVKAHMKKYEDGSYGVVVDYYLSHEVARDNIEKYIKEKGYDKTVKIEYELVGDPDAAANTVIVNKDKIEELLDGFVKKNKLHCSVCNRRDYVEVVFTDQTCKDKEEEALKKFMTEQHIDQFYVYMYCEDIDLTQGTPDITIEEEESIYHILRDYAEAQGIDAQMSVCMPRNNWNSHGIVILQYIDPAARRKLSAYADKTGCEQAYISYEHVSGDDAVTWVGNKIAGYIRDNGIKGYIQYPSPTTISITYRDTYADVAEKIGSFIKERRYDTTDAEVVFQPINCELKDPNEPITDPDMIFLLLSEYLNRSVPVTRSNSNGVTYIHMTVGWHEKEAITQKIWDFLKKNNIDAELRLTVTEGVYEVLPENPYVTLKGDADLNGTVDLADLIAVAKYNLSSEAFPLKNETAEANADMNGDSVVDGLDTSALIENQLGENRIGE